MRLYNLHKKTDDKTSKSRFEGEVNGFITSPKGPQTFGWDAIFVPEGSAQTFCRNGSEVSHRYLACQKLKDYLNSISSI